MSYPHQYQPAEPTYPPAAAQQPYPAPAYPTSAYPAPGRHAPPQPYPGQPYPAQGGYAVPAGYPARSPYPAQAGAVPYPAAPTAAADNGVYCRICGCVPAAQVTFRQHRGMIVIMQFLSSKGPFCRDCGLAVFRDMTAKTLVQGWYGYASSIITPITVLINLVRRGAVANLAQPRPPANGRPYRRPLDPGPALFARPSAILGSLIPFGLLVLVVTVVAISAASS